MAKIFKNLYTLDVLFSEAQNNNVSSAKQLITHIAKAIQNNEPIPSDIREWLSDCLNRTVQGENFNKISGLTAKKGRPKKTTAEQDKDITNAVRFHKTGRHKAENRNGEIGAYSEVGKIYKLDADTVAEIYLQTIENVLYEEEIVKAIEEGKF